jgi:predicted enzyme related to lactoylglutathione lyase
VNVDDIEASLKALVDAGATIQSEPRDVGGGNLIAAAIDANGNVFGLSQSA